MNEGTIDIPEIGQVNIKESLRAKRVSIRLKPFKGVSLVVPAGIDIQEAIKFVHEKKAWIIKNLKKLEEKEERLTIFDETTEFKSRSFALKITAHSRKDVRLQLKEGTLLVNYPSHVSVTDDAIQESIRFGIEKALRMEAKRFLPGRLAILANEHGIRYNNVTIKNLKSRWGSCSGCNNINLNLHLMRLPDELIDYVLLHELSHVREKNHGPRFWTLLDQLCDGKARELDKAMNEYQTKIY
ncbi:M48 family metallopeptidase [Carboxylicivirga sp. N1Y90]|uniref:M48 family metallopeptidase n=1 Tax=Carboxylicivirga fragile TaxID=3417571 RepID=UPI003D3511B6|nr:M48 family metallopeptidase [Marinilabiliaceae bacterium N1Y90]